MTRWGLAFAVLFALLTGTLARAEPGEAEAFLERWLAAQNGGDFEAYQKLYGTRFQGVRRSGNRSATLDRAGWLKERERMFKRKMTVTAEDRTALQTQDGHRLIFKQTWASVGYKDVGTKRLELVREDGELRIGREEMLDSQRDLGIDLKNGGQAMLVWAAGNDAIAREGLDGLVKVAQALGSTLVFGEGFPQVLDRGSALRAGEAAVVLGVCEAAEVRVMLDLFTQLGTRVEVRPVTWPKSEGPTCPLFGRKKDGSGAAWGWPGSFTSTKGAQSLTVVALRREGGDEHRFVAVLKNGRAIRAATGVRGVTGDARLESLAPEGAVIVARESWVERPCTAASAGEEYKRLSRTTRFAVSRKGAGAIDVAELDRKVVETGQCPAAKE